MALFEKLQFNLRSCEGFPSEGFPSSGSLISNLKRDGLPENKDRVSGQGVKGLQRSEKPLKPESEGLPSLKMWSLIFSLMQLVDRAR